jgi:glycerol uptake facilitator-like aquaporin
VTLARRLTAEALGTAFLLAAVVGSGIMGERLAAGNEAVALLANTAATAAALYVLIHVCGPISGAHFNPVVTLVVARRGDIELPTAALYIATQVAAALAGTAAAHLMFGEPLFTPSAKARAGLPLMFSEFVATFGLIAAILACLRHRPSAVPGVVASYIAAAYWFTASTSFANPAVTVARALTDTFSGIRPDDAPGFIAAQLLGGAAAATVFGWLLAAKRPAQSPLKTTVPRAETS